MNSVNLIFTSEADFVNTIRLKGLSAEKQYLIRVHTCIHSRDNIMSLIEMIRRHLPQGKIIGSSTSIVIFEGQMMSDCCMISITEFSSAKINTCLISLSGNDSKDFSGRIVADRAMDTVLTPDSQSMLAFFARPYIKINSFVERVNECSKVQMIGGVANTPLNPTVNTQMDAFVFDSFCVSNNSVAIAVIDSDELKVYSDLTYVTEPVGSTHTITDADGMIIRAIDGENAVEWYQKQLGINLSDKRDYDTTVLFPVVRSDYDDMPWAISFSPQNDTMRIFDDEPDPVMFVPSEAKAGEHVRISYSSLQKTIENCEDVCTRISENPAEVLFGYSCISRIDMFSNCAKWELLPFAGTNLCGALVAGELGNSKNINRYCNYSFAIAALSESPMRIKLNIEALRSHSGELGNSSEHIIDYLINFNKNCGDDEALNKQQREIEDTLFKDDTTGLYNLTKYSYDFSMGKFDKICMITFRNELLINAFMSKSKFNEYYNRFCKVITDRIQTENCDLYLHKRACVIITGSPVVCDSEFVDLMQSVQALISDFKYGEYIPVAEFSIVMHEEDMVNKAEMTLESMRKKKTLFLHYTSDLGLEQLHARKLKMLSIINDAIANNRVIPYFQGIRDNSSGKINLYESLMRIEDSSGSIYTPFRFMDTAKEYGYYSDISFMMISKVLSMFRDREEMVSINLSISDISDYKIINHILNFLKTAPHPGNFIFELTETEEIKDYQLITAFVDQIHQMGGKIAIDDFGSGFSNIVNILKVESDYIKIDGEIVRNICHDQHSFDFMEMFTAWGRRHNKEIIAEYTENQEIQDQIEKLGIRYSQGYLYSRPARELCGEDGDKRE